MFIKQADYLEIYSACFEVTKDYGKCQDLSKAHPEDGPNWCVLRGWLLLTEHFENIALSDLHGTNIPWATGIVGSCYQHSTQFGAVASTQLY